MSDTWPAVQGVLNGIPTVVKLRAQSIDSADSSKYPVRVSVSWYTGDQVDASGMAPSVENALLSEMERDHHAIMVGLIILRTERQWVFYANDGLESRKRVITALQNLDQRLRVEVRTEQDRKWRGYQLLIDAASSQ